MKPRSLRSRVLLAIAAVVMVSTLATALGSGIIVQQFAGKTVEARLQSARTQLRRHLANRDLILQRSLRVLSTLPLLRQTLLHEGIDRETLEYCANELCQLSGFDRAIVRQGSGDQVEGQAPLDQPALVIDADSDLRRGAAEGEFVSGVVLDKRYQPYLASVVPVALGGRLLGTVLFADRIDDDLAHKLSVAAANALVVTAHGQVQADSGMGRQAGVATALEAGVTWTRDGRGQVSLDDGRALSTLRMPLGKAEVWLLRDSNEFEELQTHIWQSIAAFGLLGVALALLISRWITSRLARPLRELADAAEAMAEGNLDVKVVEAGPEETVQVGAAFNHMAAQVKALIEEVQHRANAMESQANELRWANKLKGEFLSSASHELRTPVTNITASVELLLRHGADEDPDARREFLVALDSETERLRRLIDKMFELTAVSDGPGEIKAEAFDVVALLRQTALDFNEEPETVQEVNWRSRCESLEYAGDQVQIRQLLLHQLDNARKFAPADSTIEVRLELGEQVLRLSVGNDGQEIGDRDRERIFQRFVQGGDLLIDKPSGLGLGLSICKQIAAQHGGTIRCQDRLGGGVEFVTILPLEPSPVSPADLPA